MDSLNYVQHYGLYRQKNEYHRFENFDIGHAWDSDHIITNQLLLNSGKHTEHHMVPDRPFYKLRSTLGSPKVPFGYFAMILIAFFPPFWRYIMDPLAQRVRRKIPLGPVGDSESREDKVE